MTIGEKIKYYRIRLEMTQGHLAELSDIHPVSIRKYETNKMQPQPSQIERIAAALGVSNNALIGIDNTGLRLKTVGDLMGVLMILLNANFLQITGERGEDSLLEYDTVKIQFNPILMPFIEILHLKGDNEKKLLLNEVILNIKSEKSFTDFLKWEKMNHVYQTMYAEYKDDASEAVQVSLNKILETKEQVELELQRSNMPLYTSDKI